MRKRLMMILAAAMFIIPTIALASSAGATLTTKTISAKALTDHECDPTEWHWVINQISDESLAPASITANFGNGNSEVVSLEKFTGGVAHYTATSNLDSTVTSTTTSIYTDWSGEFNLSHGPCNTPPPTAPPVFTGPPPLVCPPGTQISPPGDSVVVCGTAISVTREATPIVATPRTTG
ncbi:MAG TPA: hypothetical protein VLE69_01970 [Candidatus Saccharimonadales bacterium]|nr:hypothetical protein [Candidatus Saccharimonadales bacterium]